MKRCSPIHSILEISDGLGIGRLKTAQNIKYLVDSFHVWVSAPSSRQKIRSFGDAYCLHLQRWLNLVHVSAEVAGMEEICGSNESVLAPSQSSDWSNFLQICITTRKSLPFQNFNIHVNQTESPLKMEAVGPFETSEHYYTAQKPTIIPSTDQQPS
jgi:hypothetical protein